MKEKLIKCTEEVRNGQKKGKDGRERKKEAKKKGGRENEKGKEE
jgi:hypothetical protein